MSVTRVPTALSMGTDSSFSPLSSSSPSPPNSQHLNHIHRNQYRLGLLVRTIPIIRIVFGVVQVYACDLPERIASTLMEGPLNLIQPADSIRSDGGCEIQVRYLIL